MTAVAAPGADTLGAAGGANAGFVPIDDVGGETLVAVPMVALGAVRGGGFQPFSANSNRPNCEALWKLPLAKIGDHATPLLFCIA